MRIWSLFPIFGMESRLVGILSTPIYLVTEAMLVRRSQKVITVSEGISILFSRYYKCPQTKVEVVRNLPSREEIPQPRDPAKNSTPGLFLIAYVGGIDGQRRRELGRFIEAISILKRTSSVRYVLKIVGGAGLGTAPPKELVTLAEELSVSDRVEFYGRVPQDEALAVAASADLGLIGSEKNVYTDITLPNKLFQYILLGVPILTSDIDGVRRVAGDGVSYYADNDPESLARIIEGIKRDLPGIKMRSLELRQRALRDLTWENEKEKYLGIFNR